MEAGFSIDFPYFSAPIFFGYEEYSAVKHNNFLKLGRWSPDGLCFLTSSDDNILRLFELPQSFSGEQPVEMRSVLVMNEAETIYDFCWYPGMSSTDSATCKFVASNRDHPVHLWDAFTGKIIGSYVGRNEMDEVIAAISTSFNLRGDKLYCGYNNSIKVFDTEIGGNTGINLAARGRDKKKQRGMMSTISFANNSHLFAVGCYSNRVILYSEQAPNEIAMDFDTSSSGNGVTQYLFAGSRRSHEILGWDLRYTESPLYRLPRKVTTSQRYTFDIVCDTERCLLITPSEGEILVYDLTHDGSLLTSNPSGSINGCAYHPHSPYLATTHGERRDPQVSMSVEREVRDSGGSQLNRTGMDGFCVYATHHTAIANQDGMEAQ
ncbi:hypothetical protein PROFUN_03222 [Planoprotostelium fungivorum]|uniref:Telomerase Cajal body protein 1 n=1 Tax=Planoprotostelium fungivorum TaxID=1890364 RepID=A0A2P6NX14_9EUKA|nr:hypothetical protein PROFUN_03222 [Planoprotostelium fungivorum]